MPADVHFISARALKWKYSDSLPGKLEAFLKKYPFQRYFKRNEEVAVKMHLGSPGAFRTIRPVFVRKVVNRLLDMGCKPFITESIRMKGFELFRVARDNGYTYESLGAPIVIADGFFGKDGVPVYVSDVIGELGVCSAIYHAPAMVVLSHVKGHIQAGFGGAIKNLGMGAIAANYGSGWKDSRGKLHAHHELPIEFDINKCIRCNQCVEVCPLEACYFDGDMFKVDEKKCWKCYRCVRVCQQEALSVPLANDEFQKQLVLATKAVLSTFKKNKILYINFLMEIQPECDCMPAADVPVVQDIGILISDDIVAIDKASLDLINEEEPITPSLASDNNIKQNVISNLHGINPYLQVEFAHKFGMGDINYRLVKHG